MAVFATKTEIEAINSRLDQLDTDMAAIAEGIKRNNETLQAIMDAVEAEKKIPILKAEMML